MQRRRPRHQRLQQRRRPRRRRARASSRVRCPASSSAARRRRRSSSSRPTGSGAPVSGGYATAAALDGLRYPEQPSDLGFHAPEWAGLERVHQLLGVQLLEPGLLREEQLARAAARLCKGEAPFNVDEWAASSAAFLVYGDLTRSRRPTARACGAAVSSTTPSASSASTSWRPSRARRRCPRSCEALPRCCSRRCPARAPPKAI